MEKKIHSILLIDDHPLIISAYKNALNYISKQNDTRSFSIEEAYDCDSALEIIMYYSSNRKSFDFVFLDINLPRSTDGQILSGEDIGLKIKKLMPNTKIIIVTAFNDNYRIYSLFKNLNPDGFLIKNDIDHKKLVNAINTIIADSPFYSKTVTKLLRNEMASNFILDKIDRKLLFELSIGTLMKDLPDILLLSLAALEKRKRRLKQVFDAESPHDKKLLQKARNKGFL